MMTKLTLVSAWFLVYCPAAIAEGFDPTAQNSVDLVREVHMNSPSLPDGIAYIESAKFLSVVAQDRFQDAVGLLRAESGLSQEKATEAVTLSIQSLDAISTDELESRLTIGCTQNGKPKTTGHGVYRLLERMDDDREKIAERHLRQTKLALGREAAKLLQQWLDIRKLSTQYVKMNHKKSYEYAGRSADDVLESMCSLT